MPGTTRQVAAFGRFTLDVDARVLLRGDEVVPLPLKTIETLVALVEHAGTVVTRDTLLATVWPGTFVDPNNLAQHVSTLRRSLDEPGARSLIETASRRGYRFVAPVTWHTVTSAASASATPPAIVETPPVRYARSGGVNIAYQVVGEGPVDLVFVMGWVSHLEEFWREPSFARFLTRLASFSRLILFDKRGTGLSDRVADADLPTLEQRMDDVRAVLDAVGSERAALLGVSEGGPMCALFAATYPAKTQALIMFGTYARRRWAPDYPWAPTHDQRLAFCAEIVRAWGGPVGIEERAPSRAGDPAFREWWARYLRHGASPGAAVALTRMNAEIDVRRVLPLVRVPSLVLHRTHDRCLHAAEGRYVAGLIPGARYVELPGIDHLPFVGDQDAVIDAIRGFVDGVRHEKPAGRVLATVVLASTRDEGALVAAADSTFRGRPLRTEDGRTCLVFDGPARAIRAGQAIVERAAREGRVCGVGVHTGECEVGDGRVRGHAVTVAQQIAAHAQPNEVVISRTVKDLVAGSGLAFRERGRHALPGGDGEWRLYAVVG